MLVLVVVLCFGALGCGFRLVGLLWLFGVGLPI